MHWWVVGGGYSDVSVKVPLHGEIFLSERL